MEQKVERNFASELEEAQKKLRERGRNVDIGDAAHCGDIGGLSNDLELPYSTLPHLTGKRWNRNEQFT